MSGVATITLDYAVGAAAVQEFNGDDANVKCAMGAAVATVTCEEDVTISFNVDSINGQAAVDSGLGGAAMASVPASAAVFFNPPVITTPGGGGNGYFPSGW